MKTTLVEINIQQHQQIKSKTSPPLASPKNTRGVALFFSWSAQEKEDELYTEIIGIGS